MDMDFFRLYKDKLLKNGYIEADKFKNSVIPGILYKYYPCAENRIISLANRELWLAQHQTFNDPHEFEFMFIDKETFSITKPLDEKWAILHAFYDDDFFNISYEDAMKVMESSKKTVSISCFTTDPLNDYFWNTYANHKNGFCVEYRINRKDNFYPVLYTDERIEVSDLLINLVLNLKQCLSDEKEIEQRHGKRYNVISEDGMNNLSLLYFNYCCKKLQWKNEDEYRIVFANEIIQTSDGKAVSFDDLCISPNKIYIGSCCSEEDKNKLGIIAKKLGIDLIHL